MIKETEEVKGLLQLLAAYGLFGLVIGLGRGIVHQRHGGLLGLFRGVVAAVIVAVLVSLALADSELSLTKQSALIGVCAYLADDILLGMLTLGKMFSTNPIGFIKEVWNSIRGGGTIK